MWITKTRTRYFCARKLRYTASENYTFHAAIVEHLHEGYPVWMRSVINGYRQPFRANAPNFASTRLLQVSARILDEDIVVPPADAQDLTKAMPLLSAECLKERCLADIRMAVNIMMRPNGQSVIADHPTPIHPVKHFG